jgi:MYXO-CTERM domain-containing protein
MKRIPITLSALAALAFLAAAAPALANGRYPAAGQIVVDPSDPKRAIIRATYGILMTQDAGQRWSWICESAVGYNGFDDPMIAITRDGSMMAGVFDGLSVTHDRGCQWSRAKGLEQSNVVDLASERADPARAVLLVSSVFAEDHITTEVWESSDNAATWSRAGMSLPLNFLGETLDAAPSDPARLYVSGRYNGPTYQGILYRSKNRGKTWEALPIPGSDAQNLPYIGAIDPKNADVLYVRRDGDASDALLASKDGGATWKVVFTPASLLGLALSPDGAMIAAGSDEDGLWIAPTSTLAFSRVADIHVRCLTWAEQGLFACADEVTDGFTAAVSTDAGKTFASFMSVKDLCDTPEACGEESPVAKVCPPLWPPIATTLGIADICGGIATGSSASSSASASSSGDGSSSSGGEGGCGCSAAGQGSLASSALALGVVGALVARRRRRSRA